ncbi:MAG: hypothetical protein IPP77_06750 [Bacteroidetes bacterium]|nr:hypothetical protein [Bacteroidota bacterium]
MTKDKKEETVVKNEMIEAAFNFWFNGQEHIRSPFPHYIKGDLQSKTLDKFFDWTNKISDRAKKEINDEIVAEKFEEILFETAAELVKTQDERLTILYPFMPRMGDVIEPKETDEHKENSMVVDRTHLKRGDQSFLKVKFKAMDSGREWETEFELPE